MQIELSGGIGNQLFQYSFAKFLEKEFGREVTFLFAPIGRKETIHNSSLFDFKLAESMKFATRGKLSTNISRVDRYLALRLQSYRKVSSNYFHRYTQKELGFVEDFNTNEGLKFFRGHFQTRVYPDSIRQVLQSQFELVQPTEDYLSLAKKAEIEQPIIMHIRRGDYLNLEDSVGILGDEYYYQAVTSLILPGQKKEIWVFSDDLEKSLGLIKKLEARGVQNLKTGFRLSDSETLKIMTLGSGIVIANSTFSWWGAFLGMYSENVVAPNKWFRSIQDPLNLIPISWQCIQPYWG